MSTAQEPKAEWRAMLKLKQSTMIGLHAMSQLARQEGATVSAAEIADHFRVSRHHVAKVLQQLVRAELVRTVRGAGGGHQIAADPSEITLLDVVEIFEGTTRRDGGCRLLDDDEGCPGPDPCRLRMLFEELDDQIGATLRSVSLKTLIRPGTTVA